MHVHAPSIHVLTCRCTCSVYVQYIVLFDDISFTHYIYVF